MKNRRLLIFILFSVILNACGQQGPLFMPVEDEVIQSPPPIESDKQEAGTH
ncbi:LPS translocon maturation chaperone LptM [Methyloprofundus sedimenti]|uniref:LPS translocon maturation chaperone LptM n=1 Tax=Methyloprofundus sedimenti TaxID=1420851 RepID=UPI0018E914F5|nr:lipoprotein [Methyloprofundus sedimenti]